MSYAKSHILCTANAVRRQPAFKPLHRSRRTFLTIFSILTSLTILCAITYIGIQVHAVHYEYKISEELQKKARLAEENKKLNLKIASLKSPQRIESFATTSLKLVPPNPKQFLYASRLEQLEDLKPLLIAENSAKLAEKSLQENQAVPSPKMKTTQKIAKAKETKVAAANPRSPSKKSSPPQGVIVAKLMEKGKSKDTAKNSISSNALTPKEKIPAIITSPLP